MIILLFCGCVVPLNFYSKILTITMNGDVVQAFYIMVYFTILVKNVNKYEKYNILQIWTLIVSNYVDFIWKFVLTTPGKRYWPFLEFWFTTPGKRYWPFLEFWFTTPGKRLLAIFRILIYHPWQKILAIFRILIYHPRQGL